MNKWKVGAITVLVILIIENVFFGYMIYLVNQDEENTLECYYEVCEEYPDAFYDTSIGLCTCYDYDFVGNLIESKYELLT